MNDAAPLERRCRPLTDLHVDTLRSALDAALRVLGEDLGERCVPQMEASHGDDWQRYLRSGSRPTFSPVDPALWLRELSKPSAARAAFPRLSSAIYSDIDSVGRVRNQLFHYAVRPDAPSVEQDLIRLGRVARSLGLLCSADLVQLSEEVHLLRTGEAHPSASLEDVLASREREAELTTALLEARTRIDLLEGDIEVARLEHDRMQQQRSETGAPARDTKSWASASNAHIMKLQSDVERLEEDASAARSFESHLDVERSAATAITAVRAIPTQLHDEFLATYELAVAAEGVLARVTSDNEAYKDTLKELGLMRGVLEDLGAQSVTERQGSSMSVLLGALVKINESRDARTPEHQNGLSPDGVQVLRRVRRLADDLAEQLLEILQAAGIDRSLEWVLDTMTSEGAAQASGDGGYPSPGETWLFAHGAERWTLSPRGGLFRNVRISETVSRREDLGDTIGRARAREVAEAFLRFRPEGGRVWVDEDGDACAPLSGGDYVYLGNIDFSSRP